MPPARKPAPSRTQKLHQDQDDDQIKHRVRIRRACESCRRRRRKCNGRFPCAQCIGYTYRCEYIGGPPGDVLHDQAYDLEEGDDDNPDLDLAENSAPERQSESYQQEDTLPPVVETEKPVEAHSAGAPTPKFRPLVDTVKGRYSNAHSSILLPRRVGQTMDLSKNIRFHSYGWNVNTRLEPTAFLAPAICRLLTFHDLSFYSGVFFDVVDPIYHFLDQKRLLEQCTRYWTREEDALEDIETIVSGVVALGSFFSETPLPVEHQLVEHAKQVLDIGCAYAPGRMSLNQTAGWILRTLYLRLTTRPHLSWYSSCSTMHVAEAMGLHVDLRNVEIVSKDSSQATPECTSSRADLFECAVFLNWIISAEYGRSRVILQDATQPISPPTSKLMKLSNIMLRIESTLTVEDRLDILSSLSKLPDEPSIFALLKTDVTIHLFRRHLHPYQEKTDVRESALLLSIIKTGLAATRLHAPLRKPWWNVLSTPFQSLMVLLTVDSDESLTMIEETMSVLGLVYNTFPTHLAAEVLQTAQTLVQGLEKRKIRQAKILSKAYSTTQSTVETPTYSNSSAGFGPTADQAEAVFENWLTGDMSWSWPPAGNSFAPATDPNLDAFNFS